jgi:hypothetical protein
MKTFYIRVNQFVLKYGTDEFFYILPAHLPVPTRFIYLFQKVFFFVNHFVLYRKATNVNMIISFFLTIK